MATQHFLSDRLAQRTKQRSMVLVPPKLNEVSSYLTNSATMTYDPGRGGLGIEGLPTTWTLSVPPGRTAGGDVGCAWLRWYFSGDAIGLNIIKKYGTFQPDNVGLAVLIDHRLYDLQDIRTKDSDGGFTYDTTTMMLLDEDLPAVPGGRAHMLEIGLIGDPSSSGNTRTISIPGFFADEVTGGYRPQPRRAMLIDAIAVPTSAASIPLTQTGFEAFSAARAIRKIYYNNTNAAARTVTITFNGGNGAKTFKTIYLGATGSAGDSDYVDFGEDVVLPAVTGTRFQHVASGSGVVATIQGKM